MRSRNLAATTGSLPCHNAATTRGGKSLNGRTRVPAGDLPFGLDKNRPVPNPARTYTGIRSSELNSTLVGQVTLYLPNALRNNLEIDSLGGKLIKGSLAASLQTCLADRTRRCFGSNNTSGIFSR